jgi:hypothetical protein
MRFTRSCVLVLAIASASAGCGGSSPPVSPTTPAAVVVLNGLTATVEPITTPGIGWLYRLTYQVRETSGTRGATLANQHFALSNGLTADGSFNSTTHVAASSTITVQSTLSVLPPAATAAASHVAFSITFTDDGGLSGSASAEADISPKNQ